MSHRWTGRAGCGLCRRRNRGSDVPRCAMRTIWTRCRGLVSSVERRTPSRDSNSATGNWMRFIGGLKRINWRRLDQNRRHQPDCESVSRPVLPGHLGLRRRLERGAVPILHPADVRAARLMGHAVPAVADHLGDHPARAIGFLRAGRHLLVERQPGSGLLGPTADVLAGLGGVNVVPDLTSGLA